MKHITIINKEPYKLALDEELINYDTVSIDQLIEIPPNSYYHVIYHDNSATVLIVSDRHDDIKIKDNGYYNDGLFRDIHVINAEKNKHGCLVVKRVQEILFD